jgi:hypothetical protein
MKVLFLNHKIQNCGVYQYGKRVIDILLLDTEIQYIYAEIDCYEEYLDVISKNTNITAVIYNYHVSTMSWLNPSNIQKNIKNIGIPHESPAHLFDIICNIDPDECETTNCFSLPRPIFENIEDIISLPTENSDINDFIHKYTDTDIPIFGSFGFGFDNKGFDKIIQLVNDQYDNAIIKFVIPIAHFDPEPYRINRIRELCFKTNKKPGIMIMIFHNFLSTTDILKFLHSNTMNIFLYDTMFGRGISSTIDYALSVKKPLAISDSYMFRHIYSDEICLYKNTIQHCVINSETYLKQFLDKYSNEKLRSTFKKILFNR